ncbi:deoxyribodipyrimidine photo-lyase [Dyadobacter luticola]|uniref:Cryptochrome DASH n=1 Tax=Dyadobacter luticola TaxID=1979387 RepID=A0A5R9KWJ0_9BACT|nr:deoxyribodipyrimidine photo-lyase [Dyadobacter luticola]TLV00541.1 cryptochrome DASH [Dyadobacter luticola]
MAQRIIYWFRNDLRLNDNEALFNAAHTGYEIVPVYVFDPRQFERTRLGFRRTGALRAQCVLDAVADLRNNLRKKGADLLIRIGEPEKIIAQMAQDYNAEFVYTSKEIGPEETRIESSLSKNLKIANIDIKLFWMDTLISAADLPFPISKLPSNFKAFLAELTDKLVVKASLPEPEEIILPTEFEAGSLPSLPTLGIDPEEIIAPAAKSENRLAGETQAQATLESFLADIHVHQENPVSLTDSRLSQWLSLGGLSPRKIYNRISTLEHSPQTELLIKDLLRRDYAHWILLRYGPRIFKPSGFKHDFSTRWTNDQAILNSWIDGKTDNQEVNAIMDKLQKSGFLAFKERITAADYLVNHLGVNWTMGAMYFESCLLDYEVSVSWGRWNNIAGVGEY